MSSLLPLLWTSPVSPPREDHQRDLDSGAVVVGHGWVPVVDGRDEGHECALLVEVHGVYVVGGDDFGELGYVVGALCYV